MENRFITDAIDIVSMAIQADNGGDNEKVLRLYRDALGRFTLGLNYEKKERSEKQTGYPSGRASIFIDQVDSLL
jgi:vacuolar protein-sorting-associated protein 4